MADEDMQNNMAVLNSRIDKIEVTLSHAVDAIEKIATVVNRPHKTDWSALASWASIIIAIGVAVYVPIKESIWELDREQSQFEIEARAADDKLEDRMWELNNRMFELHMIENK